MIRQERNDPVNGWSKSGVRSSNEKIKSMSSSVSFKINMLRKVEGAKKCIEGNGVEVKLLVHMYIEISSDD